MGLCYRYRDDFHRGRSKSGVAARVSGILPTKLALPTPLRVREPLSTA